MRSTAALALTAANEKQIVDRFLIERAVNGRQARPLKALGLGDSKALRAMVLTAVIRRAGPERYYLDERAWANRRQLRGRTAVRALLAVGLAGAAVAVYWMGR